MFQHIIECRLFPVAPGAFRAEADIGYAPGSNASCQAQFQSIKNFLYNKRHGSMERGMGIEQKTARFLQLLDPVLSLR